MWCDPLHEQIRHVLCVVPEFVKPQRQCLSLRIVEISVELGVCRQPWDSEI